MSEALRGELASVRPDNPAVSDRGAPDPAATRQSGAAGPPSIKEYLPALDGMRTIVAVTVVAGHIAIYTGDVAAGWNGRFTSDWLGYLVQPLSIAVPFFCVMSGMLLYRQFDGMALTGAPMPAVRAYLWRRALRVLPLYWLVVIVALAAVTHVDVWNWIRCLLFLTIYHGDKYNTADLPDGLVPTWSLACEVVFYLLLPVLAMVLAWLAARFGRDLVSRAKVVVGALGSLVAANLVWVIYTHLPHMGQWPLQWYWLPSLIGYFAAGMALAVLADWVDAAPDRAPVLFRAARRRPYLVWLVAGAALIALGVPRFMGRDANTFYPGVVHGVVQFFLHLICATAIVLAVMAGRRRNRFLSNRVMVFGGQLSYGVYLWHQVVLVGYFKWRHMHLGEGNFALITLLVLPAAFLLAAATYLLVERPLRRTLRPLLGRAPATFAAPATIGQGVVQ